MPIYKLLLIRVPRANLLLCINRQHLTLIKPSKLHKWKHAHKWLTPRFVVLLYYVLNLDLSSCKWVNFVTQKTRHQSYTLEMKLSNLLYTLFILNWVSITNQNFIKLILYHINTQNN
jgi:hypothetical protein